MKNCVAVLIVILWSCGGPEHAKPPTSAPAASSVPGQQPTPPAPPPPPQPEVDASVHYGKFLASGIPKSALDDALQFFASNQQKLENRNVVSIADYSAHSSEKRFYLLHLATGQVEKEVVAHGSGKSVKRGGARVGDPNHDGILDRCVHEAPACCTMTPTSPGYVANEFQACLAANDCREGMSLVGFMKVGEPYVHTKNLGSVSLPHNYPKIDDQENNAVKIDGLDWRNMDGTDKEFNFHEEWFVRGEGSVQGRSPGQPVFAEGKGAAFFKKMQGGSLYYAYAPQCN